MTAFQRQGSAFATGRLCAAVAALAATAAIAIPPPEHPEQRLRNAVEAMQAGETQTALTRLDALVRDEPTFRLAQLFHGQLLAARSGQWEQLSLPANDNSELGELLEEARLRMAGRLPGPDELPLNVMRLPDNVRYAIAVDLEAARLYLVENNGELRVRKSMYASMGSAGYGKELEGDLRTPVGVYRVTQWLDGVRLPDLYGSGAFPVDYPNDWDRSLRRTGHGIWLHGVPSGSYTRPPRSSEGCVTVANADLIALRDYVVPGVTPVIFADRIEWAAREQASAKRADFEATLDRWRMDWASLDTDAYLAHYAPEFVSGNQDRETFAAHKRRVNSGKSWAEIELDELGIYRYPGEENLMQVRFIQDYRSSNFSGRSRKLQYWRLQDDGQWRIIREANS